MRQFDYKEWVGDPTKELVTRDGNRARIVAQSDFDRSRNMKSLVALVAFRYHGEEMFEYAVMVGDDGTADKIYSPDSDLFFKE